MGNDSQERWLPVVGWEGEYEVSDCGGVRVFARYLVRGKGGIYLDKGGPKLPHLNPDGYRQISLYKVGGVNCCARGRKLVRVHTLVLEAFVRRKKRGEVCRHLNGIRHDNRLENLAWGTHEENSADMDLHGTRPRWEGHRKAKLSNDDVRVIRSGMYSAGTLAEMFAVSVGQVKDIIAHRSWVGLPEEEK